MKKLAIILYALNIITACAVDSGSDPDDVDRPLVDPVGTWRVGLTFGAGDCGQTGSTPFSRSLVRSTTGNLIDDSTGRPGYQYSGFDNDGRTVSGHVSCNPDFCQLVFIEDKRTPTANTLVQGNWFVDVRGVINGSGNVGIALTDATCSQNWSVIGTLE